MAAKEPAEYMSTYVERVETTVSDEGKSKGLRPAKTAGSAATRLYDEAGNLRLIPTPTTDPNDVAGSMTACNSVGPLVPTFDMYYANVPLGEVPPSTQTVSQLATFPSLFIGVGAIISVILCRWLGTRPVLILSSALVVASTTWAATSHGKGLGLYSHIAARCFMGLGTGAVESLVPLILQDMYYIHNRNTQIAIIWAWGGVVSGALGSASTYIVQHIGWRWFYWILDIISCVALAMIILVVPETTFPRTEAEYNGEAITNEDGFAEPVRSSGRERSYIYSVRVISEHTSIKQAWYALKELVLCSGFPNVVWIVLLNAAVIGPTISSSNTIGLVLISSYHWAPQNVGLLSVPLTIASFIVVPIAGVFADWFMKTLARRNNGQHTPEHQILNLAFPLVCSFLGTLLFGVFAGQPEQYHWSLPLLMTGFQFFALLSTNVTTTTYAIECFPDLAATMVIIVGAYRNIVGFGITYGAQAFVDRVGFQHCFGTYAAIVAFFSLFSIPVYLKGPALRQWIDTWRIRNLTGNTL
ncbi:hypothetical protein SBRCBS47491_007042 [Sporothrix bragantina]|uniref:Major facilitator superfamily (MFS) profile domain-containing protein n=1 Tax=Sporothrix bragantina TaxID=671064 RepID=A0ABP0CBH2_9PEZI